MTMRDWEKHRDGIAIKAEFALLLALQIFLLLAIIGGYVTGD